MDNNYESPEVVVIKGVVFLVKTWGLLFILDKFGFIDPVIFFLETFYDRL